MNGVIFLAVFHFIAVSVNVVSYIVQVFVYGVPFWGNWTAFLTLWNQFCQIIFFSTCFVLDLYVLKTKREIGSPILPVQYYYNRSCAERLLTPKDRLFALLFSVGTVVGVVYWAVIFPHETLQGHQFVLTFLFIWIELLICFHKFFTMFSEVCILGLYSLCYVGWSTVARYQGGAWPYFFLDHMPWWKRACIFGGIMLFSILSSLLARMVNHLRWKRKTDAYGRSNEELLQSPLLPHYGSTNDAK